MISVWAEGNESPEAARLREWVRRTRQGDGSEPLIDMFVWVGQQQELRPLGLSILEILRSMRLCDVIDIAGRRMIFLLSGIVMARLNKTTLRQNIMNPAIAVESLSRMVEILQSEFAFSCVPDISAFAESYGCEVKIPEDGMASVTRHAVRDLDDLARLEAEGPQWHERLMNNFTVLSSMAQRFTLFKLVLGGGPFSMAAILAGVEELARKIIKEPAFVERLLEFCTNVSILAARGQVSAGADVIYLGDPTSGLLSRKHYERFAAPYIRRVVAEVDVPVVLHICGKTTHIIEPMCATGVQGISLDTLVDLPSIVSRVPSDIAIIGNLDPVGPLLNGTPEETALATRGLLESMRDVPNYMFSAGCELALETPLENIRAMIETVKSYR
ncbi:MAG: uroporphyrinogen decarboxylase family protein [Candidatus Abyssubacteria bacterium]